MTVKGWVIERGISSVDAPEYFSGLVFVDSLMFDWEKDPYKAVRFCRKEDAENVVDMLDHRVVEHEWTD